MPAGADRPSAEDRSSHQRPTDVVPATVRALLTGLVDYAGLFPPAALSMAEVVENYASYLASPDAWMLGRLVIPASRLAECHAERSEESACWRVSALLANLAEAPMLSAKYHGLDIDSCELKASTVAEINAAADVIDPGIATFVEIPVTEDPALLLDAIAKQRLNAKIRTGGVTPDAFPAADHVARFLLGCHERDIAFKATAGLHHPMRGTYRLTYAADAPTGVMYGFLNVSAAASAARRGARIEDVEDTLTQVDHAPIDNWARGFFLSFGSCSFREPVDDLERIGVL